MTLAKPPCFLWTENQQTRVMIVDAGKLSATATPKDMTGLVTALQQAQRYGCGIETLWDADQELMRDLNRLFDTLAARRQARARGGEQ